jgi:hypothetical protein
VSSQCATFLPITVPCTSAVRKWMPPQTRASMTSLRAAERRSKWRGWPGRTARSATVELELAMAPELSGVANPTASAVHTAAEPRTPTVLARRRDRGGWPRTLPVLLSVVWRCDPWGSRPSLRCSFGRPSSGLPLAGTVEQHGRGVIAAVRAPFARHRGRRHETNREAPRAPSRPRPWPCLPSTTSRGWSPERFPCCVGRSTVKRRSECSS